MTAKDLSLAVPLNLQNGVAEPPRSGRDSSFIQNATEPESERSPMLSAGRVTESPPSNCNAPPDQPVTQGVYGITRHPQNMASSLVILGCTIAIGSWLALILFVVARIFLHQNLVAEEEVCLQEYGEAYRSYMERSLA